MGRGDRVACVCQFIAGVILGKENDSGDTVGLSSAEPLDHKEHLVLFDVPRVLISSDSSEDGCHAGSLKWLSGSCPETLTRGNSGLFQSSALGTRLPPHPEGPWLCSPFPDSCVPFWLQQTLCLATRVGVSLNAMAH